MSGIAGLLRLDDAFISPGAIEAMAATMARRGPDGRRVWRDGPVALGHALLATTPEATAERQPWRHPETACVVVSDSRLDNRPELVRTLNLRAAEADEVGDGELLHAAYQRWGEGCAERLLGDFAFAIFDPRESRVLCARDVMGVRPFYYHHAPRRLFAFASEADALLSHAEVPADLNHGRIADALVGELEGIDRTSTFYAAVTRLPPAHTLIVDRKGLRLREYWHPLMRVPRGLPGAEDEWIDAVREQVVQAVRRRLRASTPVGSMLSGGLDSSAVVASAHVVAREQNAPAIHTFSGIDSAGACPETRAVHSMVRHVRATPTTLDLQDLDATAAELRPHLENRAEPFDGSMTLVEGMYWAASRAGVRALMDGMPADNLYPSGDLVHQLARRGQWLGAYSAAVDTHCLQARWWPGLRALATVAGTWAPGSYHRLRSRWAERSFYQRELLAGSLIAPDFARQVGLWDRYMAYRDDMRRTMMGDSSGRSLTCMTAAYITAAVERYGRTAAFHAVEPRHPFLDRELVELHAWLPLGLRQRAGSEKWALRRAMEKLMPADVAWRPKTVHLGHRFNAVIAGPACEDLGRGGADGLQGYVDPSKLETAGAAWRARRDPRAFCALQSAALLRLWLRRERARLYGGHYERTPAGTFKCARSSDDERHPRGQEASNHDPATVHFTEVDVSWTRR